MNFDPLKPLTLVGADDILFDAALQGMTDVQLFDFHSMLASMLEKDGLQFDDETQEWKPNMDPAFAKVQVTIMTLRAMKSINKVEKEHTRRLEK